MWQCRTMVTTKPNTREYLRCRSQRTGAYKVGGQREALLPPPQPKQAVSSLDLGRSLARTASFRGNINVKAWLARPAHRGKTAQRGCNSCHAKIALSFLVRRNHILRCGIAEPCSPAAALLGRFLPRLG